MFLVAAESRQLKLFGMDRQVWMLKASSVPLQFYQEVWKAAPSLASGGRVSLIGGLYGLHVLGNPADSGPLALFLVPAWTAIPGEDRNALSARLSEAARGLIAASRQ
jgi:hypothetical protein